jgi:hypothetical protein
MDAPQKIQIFLSSPGDVVDERNLARRVIKEDLSYDPFIRGWVTFDIISWDDPASPTPMPANLSPQEAVNRNLPKPSECDFVVVVFWSRMGTPLSEQYRKSDGERYLSGTEWEFEDALKGAEDALKNGRESKPTILVYRRMEVPWIGLTDPDMHDKRSQYESVEKFFQTFRKPDGSLARSFISYKETSEFSERLKQDLCSLLKPIIDNLRAKKNGGKSENQQDLEPLWSGSPYPGLRTFTADEAAIFFGRGSEVDKLVKLHREPEQRFLAIVGASGTGKSSLVRAGLLSRLKENAIEGSKDWRVLSFRPGDLTENPFELLALKLCEMLPANMQRPPRELATRLQLVPEQIAILAEQVLEGYPKWAELLLFVDQLEELFTLVKESYRSLFVTMLSTAAANERIRVVVTLRADFLTHAAESATRLPELLQAGTFPLASPREAAMSEMIRRPAARAGLTLEDALADEILKDAGTDPGALPLMAFCLDELYRQTAPDHRISLAAYHKIGGLKGAIGHQATRVGERLPTNALEALPRLFQALVHVDAVTGATTRQQANRAEITTDDAAAAELLEALIDARLLQANENAEERQATIEVAHEALFDSWPQLHDWLRDNQTFLQRRTEIEAAMARWEREERDPNELLTGKRLAEAIQIASQRPYFLTQGIRLYIKLSQEREKNMRTLSDQEISRFIHEQAYKVSEERKLKRLNYLIDIVHQKDFFAIIKDDPAKIINIVDPEDEEKVINDWHVGKMRFVSDVLEGNINFALRIPPESYPQLEREWLEDFKKHKAYSIWEARDRGFDLDSGLSNYHAACKWIVGQLTDRDRKMPKESFANVQEYIQGQILTAGILDISKRHAHELVTTKARRLHYLRKDNSPNENWLLAEKQAKLYYENIIPAVIQGDQESIRQIADAIEPAKIDLTFYQLVNCFEITLVAYFVNMDTFQV